MAGQSLGPCRHFSHVSIKHNLFLLFWIVWATSLSARLFTRVTGVVSLPSDGSPQFLAYECLCYYFADRVPVYVVSVNNADNSVPIAAFHDGRARWWGRFFLCHSQVNGAKVVRCDDNSNNVIVARATCCIVGPPAMVVSPSGSLSALPTVGPTLNLAGWQPLLSTLFNHVIVILMVVTNNNTRNSGSRIGSALFCS